jgi:riboflavin synthase
VNLERSLTLVKPLGGHFVQGHVNGTGRITGIGKMGANVYATVSIPSDLIPYCVGEGSIALDGISLTISEMSGNLVTINVIPYTFRRTTIQYKQVGDMMNIETDLLGRYVSRFLELRRSAGPEDKGNLTEETLRRWGW